MGFILECCSRIPQGWTSVHSQLRHCHPKFRQMILRSQLLPRWYRFHTLHLSPWLKREKVGRGRYFLLNFSMQSCRSFFSRWKSPRFYISLRLLGAANLSITMCISHDNPGLLCGGPWQKSVRSKCCSAKQGKVPASVWRQELPGTNERGRKMLTTNIFSFYLKEPLE